MKGALLLLAWLATTPPEPQVVVVNERESLAQVAQRTLGDPRGASELKALNGLTSDDVPAGTTLRLPSGEHRKRALNALAVARTTVAQADCGAACREETEARLREAETKLREAESFFQSAHYQEAAHAADEAWRLLPASARQATSFQVKVDDGGTTTLSVAKGQPVRVTAENTTRMVSVGETVRVEKGKPPPPPTPPLAAPQPKAPAHAHRFHFPAVQGRLGPVMLEWNAVAGAQGYEVELQPPTGEPLRLPVTTPQARLPPLPAGRYRWTVRAVSESLKSEASNERSFELVEDRVKLRVKEPNWQ